MKGDHKNVYVGNIYIPYLLVTFSGKYFEKKNNSGC